MNEESDVEKAKEHLEPLNHTENEDDDKKGIVIKYAMRPINAASAFGVKHKKVIQYCIYGMLILSYLIYFCWALAYNLAEAAPLVILTVVVLCIALYEMNKKKLIEFIKGSCCKNNSCTSLPAWICIRRILNIVCLICILAFFIWLIVSIIMSNPSQLISLLGLGLLVAVCFFSSKYPGQICWRPVLWGIGLQFILGLIVLRTTAGFKCVKFIGDQVATFMRYTDAGSSFVFGNAYEMHFFAFKVLPMIVFFSTVMNMLYYLGVMQWFIGKLAWITEVSLGTSAIESTVAAANIFVGMTEAPLVVRPYLNDLTKAEFHSVLTSGLGSIAFSVFGAFVEFKVDSVHLLTACVMSAPASLAISRLLYPEKKKSKFVTTDSLKLSTRTDRNLVEAAAAGASMSIGLVANIAANLIAFLALLEFLNSTLHWFGAFVGYPDVSFQVICSYLFMPLAYLMGADWEDCGIVGELFGIKTFLNEFIAYKSMKPYIENRLAGDVPKYVNGTIQFMSKRSEIVAIHALCGFCNVSSLGIIIGGIGSLVPERRKDLAELAIRALMGGILTCCMTASIASLLYIDISDAEIHLTTIATTLNDSLNN